MFIESFLFCQAPQAASFNFSLFNEPFDLIKAALRYFYKRGQESQFILNPSL